MSRRASATQRIVVQTNTIATEGDEPPRERHETIASASPAALISGRMLGAGMWISSPTGRIAVAVVFEVAHVL